MGKQVWKLYIKRPNDDDIYSNSSFIGETLADVISDYINDNKNRGKIVLAGEPLTDADAAAKANRMTNGFAFNRWRVEVLTGVAPILSAEPAKPIGPRKPEPQLRVEVWNDKPVDPAAAWAAVQAMCKGE